ncbi:oligopeptide/dipeptide ABC transporter ATP-binding protein [Terrabacter sp. NPDC080008]|uniref:ABC transporter ATP-binding protein n=1 Tax=Terrabacter sp. NPDC080008 TaxID=3155176 RepID=UPI0034501EB0
MSTTESAAAPLAIPVAEPALRATHVSKTFTTGSAGRGRQHVKAVRDVSLVVHRGESLGIVGESGCGKTTLARMLVGLEQPDSGTIEIAGEDVTRATGSRRRALTRDIQMVFQDPYTSLNPRMSVLDLIAEPLRVHRTHHGGAAVRERVAELLDLVNLSPDMMGRYPHQFSGGQRQRIGIARAIALEPKVLVCDEPVSALDVSVQAQVVNLLRDLQLRLGIAVIFIAHDLGVVRHISDRTAVMYLGSVVETAATADLFATPAHPYSQALLSASPTIDRERSARRAKRIVLQGDPPSPINPPSGCSFHTRCRFATEVCSVEVPPGVTVAPEHQAVCHHTSETVSLSASETVR